MVKNPFSRRIGNMEIMILRFILDMIEFKDPILFPRPPLTNFSKCFYLDYFGIEYYKIFINQLHMDDFLFMNLTTRLLSENHEFELYCFLNELDKKGILFHLYTPIFDLFLKELYSKEFHLLETYPPHTNPKNTEYLHLNITNYLPKLPPLISIQMERFKGIFLNSLLYISS